MYEQRVHQTTREKLPSMCYKEYVYVTDSDRGTADKAFLHLMRRHGCHVTSLVLVLILTLRIHLCLHACK